MPALSTVAASPPRPIRAHFRVLVVEDDPLFRRFVLAALGEARVLKVDAVPVGSLHECVQALAAGGFDCILLDLGLPDGQDVESVRRVMAAAPGVPIVVLTGQEGGSVADRMLQEGAQDYLEKAQLEPGSLERSLRHAVDRGRWTLEMAQKNRELEDRNQDLDDFAHAVSHDLKAPLRAIFHLARDAQEHLAASDLKALHDDLDGMPPRISRLFGMIDGVLALTQAGRRRSDAAPVDVARLVQDIVGNLEIPAGFVVRVAPTLPTVIAEQAALTQVFQNLIDNAIKHNHGETGMVEVGWRDGGAAVEFTVADDGPGIPAHQRERAFQLFQKLNGANGTDSTGVGLALVRKVVEAQGGKIDVEDRDPKGACFRFTWPKTPQP
ncbi:MAG: ATP-binding protein [Thermoplasmatota archaeon]